MSEEKIDQVMLVRLAGDAKHPRGIVHVRKNGAFTCLRILSVGGSKLFARATDVASDLRLKLTVLFPPSKARNDEKGRFQCEKLSKQAFLAPKTCKTSKKAFVFQIGRKNDNKN